MLLPTNMLIKPKKDEDKEHYEEWESFENLPPVRWWIDSKIKGEQLKQASREGELGDFEQGTQFAADVLTAPLRYPLGWVGQAIDGAASHISDYTGYDKRSINLAGTALTIASRGKYSKSAAANARHRFDQQMAKLNAPIKYIKQKTGLSPNVLKEKPTSNIIDMSNKLDDWLNNPKYSKFKQIPAETSISVVKPGSLFAKDYKGVLSKPQPYAYAAGSSGGLGPAEARFNNSDKSDDPFFSSIDPSNKTQIEKFLNKYWDKEQTNLGLMRGVQRAQELDPNITIPSKDYRNIAGFIHLDDIINSDGQIEQGLINIAKEDNRNINDVYEYLKIQSVGNKQMKQTIDALNLLGRKDSIAEIKSALNELAVKGNFRSRTYNRWLRLLRYAETYKIFEKGHKESLFQMFLKSTTGGDRLSNTFIQAIRDKKIQNYKGETITIKGNRSLGSSEDLPIYTIVKLRGGSRNLKEDFRKTIMPKEFPSESIGEEFEEIAEILYRNSMDEVGTHFNPNDIDYDANVSGYSIALTDAIHAMMKAADDMGIHYIKVEDEFLLEIPNSISRKQKQQLLNIYDKALENTLNNLSIEME